MWMTDRDGKIINVPEGWFDHSMDALRYGVTNLLKNPTSTFDSSTFLMKDRQERTILSDIGL